ncbi:MAG: efflux RND transporter permease subunit [Myxococcota bacterium]|nr:efflux RND transporter permease subunit [Myxococcota bacterium]
MAAEPAERPELGGVFGAIVDRPVAVLMVFLAAAVFGYVSYAQLPLTLMPDLSYPSLTVRTEYSGAAPEEVESQVSRPIEESLSTTDGLVGIESRSRAELSDVVLTFAWGTDMSAASQGVRERLQTTWLGDGPDRPLILHYDPSLDPILRIAMSAQAEPGKEEAALLALRELAEEEVKRELEAIDGVAAVRVRGGLERQVLVQVREDWMQARSVTLEQVQSTLLSENVNIAGGSIREGDTEFLIRTLNQLSTVQEVEDLEVIRADGTGIPVSEVAVVQEAFKERKVVSHLDGAEAVELEIFKEADANIVSVAQAVKQRLGDEQTEAARAEMPPEMAAMMGPPGLVSELPEGVSVAVLDDQARFIEDAIANLRGTAVIGGLLAVGILFMFLRSFRATAIIGTAIPVSVIATFAALYLGDVSLNLMSLGGLALGIGMLVDNAVVVLESIQVHLDAGRSRRDAAVIGTREVSAAVTASTLTTVAVFLPIVFVDGVAGQIFGDLALAVVFSLLASLAVALVLVPMLAARRLELEASPGSLAALTPEGRWSALPEWREALAENRARKARWLLLPYQLTRLVLHLSWNLLGLLFVGAWALSWRAMGWVGGKLLPPVQRGLLRAAEVFGGAYDRLASRYPPLLSGALQRPGLVLGGAAVALIAALALRPGAELIPEVHQGRFTAAVAMPVGTPLDRTVAVVSHAEEIIAEHPEVARVYSAIGSEGRADAGADEGEHSARILVELTPGGDLAGRQAALIEDLRAELGALQPLQVQFEASSLVSVDTPLEVVVSGQDLQVLQSLSAQVEAELAQLPGVRDVQSSLVPGFPELRVRYDRAQLERFGLTTSGVARSLRDKVQGAEASRLARGERRVDLVVQLAERDRSTLRDLERININPALDPPIPLAAVASIEQAEGPSEIRRIDQRRGAVVSANLEGLDLATTADAVSQVLVRIPRPPGYSFELAGQSVEMQRSLRSLAMALLLAVFLVYVIMASTFESLVQPLVILFSVPLAAVGVMPVLLLTGSSLSVVAFIGLIVLAGMVVNNAIVLVDRIGFNREQGMDLDAAIQEAGKARLRPILITTLTTALGLLPLSLGLGAGSEIQQPLAITVIAGLSASTLLTLVVIPVVYRGVIGRLGRTS